MTAKVEKLHETKIALVYFDVDREPLRYEARKVEITTDNSLLCIATTDQRDVFWPVNALRYWTTE